MPDRAHLTAFALAALTIAAIPGPGLLYVLARSLAHGRGEGLRSSIGTGIGGLVHVLAAAVGLSAIVATSAVAFSVVKYAGAAYLIYLGLRALTRRDEPPAVAADASPRAPTHAVRQGILTEALNPKTALFFVTFLPQFCQPSHGALALQILVLGAASVALNTSADVALALCAGRLSERLQRSPRLWRRQQRTSGAVLVGLGVYAATART